MIPPTGRSRAAPAPRCQTLPNSRTTWLPCSTWGRARSGWSSAEIVPKPAIRTHRRSLARRPARARHVLHGRRSARETLDAALPRSRASARSWTATASQHIRAVATSAVREARNAEMFLDRIRGTHRHLRSRSSTKPRRAGSSIWRSGTRSATHRVVQGRLDAAGRSRRRQHRPDAAPSRPSEPLRRLRAGRGAAAAAARPQAPQPRAAARAAQALHRERDRGDARRDPAPARHAHDRARRRRPVRRRAAHRAGAGRRARVPRDEFLAFCDEVERLDEEALVERFRLPSVEAETLVPAMLIYRALLAETAARACSSSPMRRCAPASLLDLAEPGGRLGAADFEQQVLASADALGQKYRFDGAHGLHVAELAPSLFDQLRERARLCAIASGCCSRSRRCSTTSAST